MKCPELTLTPLCPPFDPLCTLFPLSFKCQRWLINYKLLFSASQKEKILDLEVLVSRSLGSTEFSGKTISICCSRKMSKLLILFEARSCCCCCCCCLLASVGAAQVWGKPHPGTRHSEVETRFFFGNQIFLSFHRCEHLYNWDRHSNIWHSAPSALIGEIEIRFL